MGMELLTIRVCRYEADDMRVTKGGVWAVGSGKGGVGKSLIASSLAVLLSESGKRALLIDTDLGAANLHTFLGEEEGRFTLSDFLKGEVIDIECLVKRTFLPNLDLVSGAGDSLDIADLDSAALERLEKLVSWAGHYDYTIIDVGPGTSSAILDIFSMADEGMLVTTPEPTSIENTYRFLKCLFLRRMKRAIESRGNGELRSFLRRALNGRDSLRPRTIAALICKVNGLSRKDGEALSGILGDPVVSIIVNQTYGWEDSELGVYMSRACKDFFGIGVGCLGHVPFERGVMDSVRARRPFVLSHPAGAAAGAIGYCLKSLLYKERMVAGEVLIA